MAQRFRKAYAGIRQERTSTPETVVANNELNQFMKHGMQKQRAAASEVVNANNRPNDFVNQAINKNPQKGTAAHT
ncbi:hypothetical protein Tco_0057862 [Tanacetum coccineum]